MTFCLVGKQQDKPDGLRRQVVISLELADRSGTNRSFAPPVLEGKRIFRPTDEHRARARRFFENRFRGGPYDLRV